MGHGTVVPFRQESLFDERPLEIAGFKLCARRVEPVGRPTLKQWAAALQLAYAADESSPFWIGDLWNYGESRPEWREKIPQALAAIGLDVKMQTIYNHGSIARRVSQKARELAPSHSHAAEVAALPADEQEELLEEASEKGWSQRDLRLNIKARKRPTVVSGQARLEGQYRVIYADPPWPYRDREPSATGAETHYAPMSIDTMCKLPIASHTQPNAVLFLWSTAPFLLANPGPRDVIEAWGFTYKTGAVWDKVLHNFGHYFGIHHEHLLVATRGSCTPDRPTPQIDSVQTIRRGDVHSEKPEDWRRIIERLYDGPYLELFGRKRVEGWTVFGNDARLWADDARASA